MTHTINIIIACDKGSIVYLDPLINSIYKWMKNPKIYLITDDEVDVKGCLVVKHENKWNNTLQRVTGHTYHRLFLDEYFPEMDKCIWLDWDTLVVDDISNILDGEDWILKAVGEQWFNAGVLCFNFTDECKELMSKCRELISSGLNDEQILNEVFSKKYNKLPLEYNLFAQWDDLTKPKIIHYVGRQKPWFTNDLYYEWFKYKSNNLLTWQ